MAKLTIHGSPAEPTPPVRGGGGRDGGVGGGGGFTGSVFDRVSMVIERLRPSIQADGGDIEVVSVDDDGLVTIRLHGACVGCPSSSMTLKLGVERNLKENVPEVTDLAID